MAPAHVATGVRAGSLLIGAVASYWLIERTVLLLSSRV
jgi:hypothetical protein